MATKNPNNLLFRHPFFIGISVFLVILLITQAIAYQRYLLNLSKIEKENTEELNTITDQLQFNLNYALSTTQTLSFIVENYGIPQNFDTIGKRLLQTNELLDGIQLLENGVITKMYPMEGNEMVIGYDVVNDPGRGKEVLIAAEREQMYFGGPFELKQGGLGVVGRVPLKVENDSLAFAAVVIRLEKLLEKSGINLESNRFDYQLSKVNPHTNQKEYFIDSDENFSESQVATIIVPLGEWQIYVKEKDTHYLEGVIPIAVLGLVLSLLVGHLTRIILQKPAELEKQVKLQTEIIFGKEKRYRALVEKSNDAVAILSEKGTPIYVSPSITSVLGYSESEALKLNLINLVHPEDLHHVVAVLEEVLDSPGIPINSPIVRVKRKDGSWRWVDATLTNMIDDPNVKGIIDNFRDITNRKEAEDLLIKEKELSEAIIDSLPGVFYLFNQEGKYLLWNTNLEKVSGYSGEEISRMKPNEFFAEEDFLYLQSRIQETFEKGESTAETYLLTKEHKKIYYYFTGRTILYNNEVCLLGTGIDLSKRKQAEEELEKSEEQLLSIFNNSISAVVMMDANGLITNWNATAEKMFGWKYEEVLNKTMHHFIMPEKHKQAHLAGMKHFKKTGEGPIINSNIEITAITKSNGEIDISLGVTTVKIRGKEYFIGFINDISARKQAERIKEFEDQKRGAMINSTSDLIWSVSVSMTLIAANEPFKASFKTHTKLDITEGDTVLPKENLDENQLLYWQNLYERAFKGEQFTVENTVPASENQPEIIMETNFNPIEVKNKIIGVACSSRNISDRIKTQQEIKDYNEKLKTAQEIAQLGYWEYNPLDSTLFWTDQIYSIWEEDPSIFSPTVKSFQDSIHPEDREKFYMFKNQPVPENYKQDIQYRIITKNGNLKWIHQFGKTFNGGRNNSKLFKGIMRDITESKIQQQTIIDYNLKLENAQKIAKLGYWEYAINSNTITRSQQARVILGIADKENDFTQADFLNLIHPDDRERFDEHHKLNLKGKKSLDIEYRIVLKNGLVKWLQDKGEILFDEAGNPAILKGTVQDITDQKNIEIELREQNQFISTALENLPIGIAVNELNSGKTTLMNKNFSQIYGWPQKELTDIDSFFEKVYPDEKYRKEITTQIISDLKSKKTSRMIWEGVEITRKDGSKRIVNAKNIPLYDQNLMISSVLDVTEKTIAEQRLALSNERFEYVTKATFDSIWDWDLIKNTIYWGEGFKTIFGYKSEVTGENFWFELIHPEDMERVKKSILNVINSSEQLNWEDEYRFKHTNGSYLYVKNRGIVLRNVERKAVRMIGAIQDITAQKEYEKKLLDINKKLRNLSAHLQEAREEERISIAREIHDELGQQLTGIKLDASWLKNVIINYAPDNIERTERLIQSINKAINDVRRVASNLRPGVLDDLGLEAAIEWQNQKFQEQTSIKCSLKTTNLTGNYSKEINTAVYRIYQEALTNVMRHAHATEVNTLLYEDENELTLEVIDNGIGIKEKDKNNMYSLGITGMRERALMIHARFLIQNQKSGGTKVKVTVPV
ncbi:MAG: PAS domain S-box protein [Flavobacteriaceae bacterium]